MSFNLIYWIPICGRTFFNGSILEKCGKIWKNGCFSGRLWPDWGNTAWAAMAGLGSIGLKDRLFMFYLVTEDSMSAFIHQLSIR